MQNNINWKKEIQDAWDIALLKKSTMNHVAKDKNKTTFAYYIIIIGGILGLIGNRVYPTYFKLPLATDLYMAIIQIVMAIVGIYLTSYIAKNYFNGKGNHHEFFRVAAYGMIVAWLGLMPQLSVIGSLWEFVIMIVALKTIHKLSSSNIVWTVIVTLIVGIIITGILSPIYKKMGLFKNPNYTNVNSKEFKMNSKNGAVEMKGNKMKITTPDGKSIEYTMPEVK